MTPFEFQKDFWNHKTRVPGLSCGVICMFLCFAISVELGLVKDRYTQTQGRSIYHAQHCSSAKVCLMGGSNTHPMNPRWRMAASTENWKIAISWHWFPQNLARHAYWIASPVKIWNLQNLKWQMAAILTRSSATAEGPQDALCQLKSCQLFHSSTTKILCYANITCRH